MTKKEAAKAEKTEGKILGCGCSVYDFDEDLDITPQLQAKIDQARLEYREGRTTTIRTHEELDAFFDSL